jgi:hypothetical protein
MPPYSRAEDNVRRLADAGVTLLAGTDAPNPGTVFGASLHRELELLVRCGISPAQALAQLIREAPGTRVPSVGRLNAPSSRSRPAQCSIEPVAGDGCMGLVRRLLLMRMKCKANGGMRAMGCRAIRGPGWC